MAQQRPNPPPWGTIAGACVGSLGGAALDLISLGFCASSLLMCGSLLTTSGNPYCGVAVIVTSVLLSFAGGGVALLAGIVGPIGTAIGAAIGAAIGGEPFWRPLVGALPGVLLGAGGFVLAAGVLLLGNSVLNSFSATQASTTATWAALGALVVAALAAAASTPVALAGSIAAMFLWPEDAAPAIAVAPIPEPGS